MTYTPKFYKPASNGYFFDAAVKVLETGDVELVRDVATVVRFCRAEENLVKSKNADTRICANVHRVVNSRYDSRWKGVLDRDAAEVDRAFLLCMIESDGGCECLNLELYYSDGDELMTRLANRVWSLVREREERQHFDLCFSAVVFRQAPQRWDGRRLNEFVHCRNEVSDWEDWDDELVHGLKTLRFGQNPMQISAFHSLLGIANWHKYVVGCHAPIDVEGDDPIGKWSLLYLLFLETADLEFNPMFKGRYSHVSFHDSELKPVRCRVVQELCGIQDGHWLYPLSASDSDSFLWSMKQSAWIESYRVCPEQTLALSFKSNGYAEMVIARSELNEGCRSIEEFARRILGYERVSLSDPDLMPDDEWKARFLMFLLARELFHVDGRVGGGARTRTVHECLFALLYLRFYRKGPDVSHFTRVEFAGDWQKIPFADKEAYAEKCRRLLIDARNASSARFPKREFKTCEMPDCLLETYFEYDRRDQMDECLQRRSWSDEELGILLVAALSASKWTYEAVAERIKTNRPPRVTTLLPHYRDLLSAAFGKYPTDDLKWLRDTMDQVCANGDCVREVLQGVPLVLGDRERLGVLLEIGVCPNQGDVYCSDSMPGSASPLLTAVLDGNADLVHLLLEYDADPNTASYSATAIAHAVQRRRFDIVQMLVEAGGDINRNANIKGRHYTPLRIALDNGDVEMVRMLIRLGADTQKVHLEEFVYQPAVELSKFPKDIQEAFSGRIGVKRLNTRGEKHGES